MENLPTLVHCSDLMSHPQRLPLPFCSTSTEARLLIRDGDGGGGGEGRVKARPRAPTRKTEEAVDRRQNNGSVKAVSPRHCAANSVLRNCCLNCCAGAEPQASCLSIYPSS